MAAATETHTLSPLRELFTKCDEDFDKVVKELKKTDPSIEIIYTCTKRIFEALKSIYKLTSQIKRSSFYKFYNALFKQLNQCDSNRLDIIKQYQLVANNILQNSHLGNCANYLEYKYTSMKKQLCSFEDEKFQSVTEALKSLEESINAAKRLDNDLSKSLQSSLSISDNSITKRTSYYDIKEKICIEYENGNVNQVEELATKVSFRNESELFNCLDDLRIFFLNDFKEETKHWSIESLMMRREYHSVLTYKKIADILVKNNKELFTEYLISLIDDIHMTENQWLSVFPDTRKAVFWNCLFLLVNPKAQIKFLSQENMMMDGFEDVKEVFASMYYSELRQGFFNRSKDIQGFFRSSASMK